MKTKKNEDKEYKIEEGLPEFNQMAYYNIRMDKRSDERDIALNQGEAVDLYRSTMTLMMNAIPRFLSKKMEKGEIEEYKKKLYKIGNKVKGLSALPEATRKKNSIMLQEELFEFNIELNNLMFRFGMIYPEREIRPLKEVIRDDF